MFVVSKYVVPLHRVFHGIRFKVKRIVVVVMTTLSVFIYPHIPTMADSTFHLQTPIGWLRITDNGRAITHIQAHPHVGIAVAPKTPLQQIVCQQINAYFQGQLHVWDVPIEPHGTVFQQRVWNALRTIPYGQTRSYSDIAQSIGQPQAARAVGNACRHNPILLLIPCHRVIGKNHQLTGFAAGLDNKRTLLQMEQQFVVAI